MTITAALVELKRIDSRLEKQIAQLKPVSVKTGNKMEVGMNSEEEYCKEVKKQYSDLCSLFETRRKMKALVVESNAKTKIKVGSVEMTVAEAIERKSSIEFEKNLLVSLEGKRNAKIAQVECANEEMNNQLRSLLESTYGRRDGQLSKDDYNRISQPFIENNEAKLIDPLNVAKEIERLGNSIEEFEADIDVALSVSNARTVILV